MIDFSQKRIIFSPFVILAIGFLIAKVTGTFLGIWAWIPIALSMWSMFVIVIAWSGGATTISQWLGKPGSSAGWSVLALAVGLIPLPLFLQNWQLFTSPGLILAWLIFALINAPLEEFYWRGTLTDVTTHWPGWASVLYSSFFFAINHPLSYGVYSSANRHPATVISTLLGHFGPFSCGPVQSFHSGISQSLCPAGPALILNLFW